jgi:hypothetical protein
VRFEPQVAGFRWAKVPRAGRGIPLPVDQTGEWVVALRELLGEPLDSRGDLSTASIANRKYDPAAVSDALVDAARRFVDPDSNFQVSGSADASLYIVDHLSDLIPMRIETAGTVMLLLADDEMVRGVNETLAVSSPADRDLALARLAELDSGSPTPSASTGPRTVAPARLRREAANTVGVETGEPYARGSRSAERVRGSSNEAGQPEA